MRAFADSRGTVYMVYRSATASVHRDIYLLSSTDRGKSFQGSLLHPWQVPGCPMSTMAFAENSTGPMTAWETDGQIFFSHLKPRTSEFTPPQSAPGPGKARKHPALAVNGQGETLLAWTEGTAWQKGDALVWQLFDKEGKPTTEKGRLDGAIPVWGLPTVAPTGNGFILLH